MTLTPAQRRALERVTETADPVVVDGDDWGAANELADLGLVRLGALGLTPCATITPAGRAALEAEE